MPVYSYQNQAVNDLAWACFSPPLINAEALDAGSEAIVACEPELTPGRVDWLARLDRQPEVLLAHLARQPGKRLGIYFERLWHFFLSEDEEFELIAHNLPVREAGRTLGEFDCLYWCRRRQRHIHLELAVKFFLGHQPPGAAGSSQWSDWLGPDSNDRLDRKLDQLQTHQLGLSELPQARDCLAELGISNVEREVALRGYLFQPIAAPLPAPPGLGRQQVLWPWLHIDQLAAYLHDLPLSTFLVLEKQRWLAPARAGTAEPLLDRSRLEKQLHSHFLASSRARLVAGLDQNGNETCRFFVTPTAWPGP